MMQAIRLAAVGLATLGAVGVPALASADPFKHPSTTAVTAADPGWLVPSGIKGTGNFTLHGPQIEGDKIRFEFDGRTARTGITHGTFKFRHHKPATDTDPGWTAYGDGEITCLRVTGGVALLTAVVEHEVVPGMPDGIGAHAFYLRIVDGAKDSLTFIQGPPPPGLPGCSDPTAFPPVNTTKSTLDTGNWTLTPA